MQEIALSQIETLPEASIDELRQEAEKCLDGTVALATAADQRATTLAGIFGAGAIGALAAYLTIPTTPTGGGLGQAIVVLAALLFVASMVAAWASRPIDFHVAGYEPRNRLAVAHNITWLKHDAVIDLQRRIDANRKALSNAAKATWISLLLAIAALPIAAFIYLRA